MVDILDVIIIGAGPAGLAAGFVLNEGKRRYLILEKGKDIVARDVNNPKDVSTGIGGGGLFSDGKLSFPPSASSLWSLLDLNGIKDAYIYLHNILNNLNINIPNYESAWVEKQETYMDKKNKEFTSIVLNNFMRNRILNFFYDINTRNIMTNCCVTTITKSNDYYVLTSSDQKVFFCKRIIISSGKFGNKLFEIIDYLV
jgi:thioredoxin reductase